MTDIHIAMAADDKYLPGLYCTVLSLLLHLDPSRTVVFHVLDGGLEDASWRLLCRQGGALHAHASFHRVALSGKSFAGFLPHRTGSLLTYARLLLADVLDVERVLYLDADLFVGRDVGPLWNVDVSDFLAAAAPDPGVGVLANDWPWPTDPGLDLNRPYFNAGVLSMNLDLWRRQQVGSRTMRLIAEHPEMCRYWDQTALNKTLLNRVRWVGGEWNRFAWQMDRAGYDDVDCILHYAAEAPWLRYTRSDSHRIFHQFLEIMGFDRPWKGPEWRASRLRYFGIAAASPLLPMWYDARAAVCRMAGQPTRSILYRKAAADWRRILRRRIEAGRWGKRNIPQIEAYMRGVASLMQARSHDLLPI